MSNDKHVCTIYIKAEPAHIWEALTTPEFTRRYFHATDIQSDWKPGAIICTSEVDMDFLRLDFNNDCKFDLTDYAMVASKWLDCHLIPVSACD